MKKFKVSLFLILILIISNVASAFAASTPQIAKSTGGYIYYYMGSMTKAYVYSKIDRPMTAQGPKYQSEMSYTYYDPDEGRNHNSMTPTPLVSSGVSEGKQSPPSGCNMVSCTNKYFFNNQEDPSFRIELTPNAVKY